MTFFHVYVSRTCHISRERTVYYKPGFGGQPVTRGFGPLPSRVGGGTLSLAAKPGKEKARHLIVSGRWEFHDARSFVVIFTKPSPP